MHEEALIPPTTWPLAYPEPTAAASALEHFEEAGISLASGASSLQSPDDEYMIIFEEEEMPSLSHLLPDAQGNFFCYWLEPICTRSFPGRSFLLYVLTTSALIQILIQEQRTSSNPHSTCSMPCWGVS